VPAWTELTASGLIAHGDIPPELLAYDNPMLQQKMRPRHLQMIAVGGEFDSDIPEGPCPRHRRPLRP
jgi:hypothetical protein